MAPTTLKPGDRLRETAAQLYGRAGAEWIVADVFVGTDGIAYAVVSSVRDPSHRKTLSVAALTDRRRFMPA
jgi:hypothetical protein